MSPLFQPDSSKIWTMPAGAPTLNLLARGLSEALGDELPDAMILLPTRRAARDLASAFAEQNGGGVVALPQLRTLADLDDSEPPFTLTETEIDIPPSVNAARRRYLMAALVSAKMKAGGETPNAAAALALADPVLSLLDDLAIENIEAISLSNLEDKIAALPAHQQDAAKFVEIVQSAWPDVLTDIGGMIDPADRRARLLKAAADIWQASPPAHPIIVAGSTGSQAAAAELICAVAAAPRGLVVLPGYDRKMTSIEDPQHPQAALTNLVERLGVKDEVIPVWPGAASPNEGRVRLIAESLIASSQATDWPQRLAAFGKAGDKKTAILDAAHGLALIEARTQEEEAACIAVIMREAVHHNQRCTLVTPDRLLVRRVQSRLSRWQISVDSSAGIPLAETPQGSLLPLTLRVACEMENPAALIALVNHPLFSLSGRGHWLGLEARLLRGPRPSHADIIAKSSDDQRAVYEELISILEPLSILESGTMAAPEMTKALCAAAEAISGGAHKIWVGDAGEKTAELLSGLIQYGEHLPDVNGAQARTLIRDHLAQDVARARYHAGGLLQILGPLEARMHETGRVILGGLNEGSWPAHPAIHPYLPRGLRMEAGLSAPERRFGLAAHDFAQLAAGEDVIMTRCQTGPDGPAVMSRWLWRLLTLIRGGLQADDLDGARAALKPSQPYLQWAAAMDAPPPHLEIPQPPQPKPPVSRRPRKASITSIETWIRNPYAVWAGKILRLKPLAPLDQPLAGREFGDALHSAFEAYMKDKTADADWLASKLESVLAEQGTPVHRFSRLGPRLAEIARWFAAWHQERTHHGWTPAVIEALERYEFETQSGPFTLTGKPDLIESSADGFAVTDYKTGGVPKSSDIKNGLAPQLTLLAWMAERGVYGQLGEAALVQYVKPNASKDADKITNAGKNADYSNLAHQSGENLQKLIAHFSDENTPYLAHPRPAIARPYGDYDHLMRRAEWALLSKEEML